MVKKSIKTKVEELNRIKEVANTKGVTAEWIAGKMKTKTPTVASWYQNRKQPHLSDLKKLASILKVDICDLITK
jgi:ribosome-binding protein aMBF1 (putative translation factor)